MAAKPELERFTNEEAVLLSPAPESGRSGERGSVRGRNAGTTGLFRSIIAAIAIGCALPAPAALALQIQLDLGFETVQCTTEELEVSIAAPVTVAWRCMDDHVRYQCVAATAPSYAPGGGVLSAACASLTEFVPGAAPESGFASGFEGPPGVRLLGSGFETTGTAE